MAADPWKKADDLGFISKPITTTTARRRMSIRRRLLMIQKGQLLGRLHDPVAVDRLALIEDLIAEVDDLIASYDSFIKDVRTPRRVIFESSEVVQAMVQLRLTVGITQRALARRLGISEVQVCRWENGGYSNVTPIKLATIADALGSDLQLELSPRALLMCQTSGETSISSEVRRN